MLYVHHLLVKTLCTLLSVFVAEDESKLKAVQELSEELEVSWTFSCAWLFLATTHEVLAPFAHDLGALWPFLALAPLKNCINIIVINDEMRSEVSSRQLLVSCDYFSNGFQAL